MGRARKYNLNENYFEKIDSEDKAYILGFIYADGSIYKNYLSIGLSDKDIEILEYIKLCLNYEGNIYYRHSALKNKSYAILSISSKIITNSLVELGVIRNKTYLSKELPKYNKIYEGAFLRGFFDGDGSIYLNVSKGGNIEYTVCFSGNLCVLNQLKLILSNYNISSGTVRHRHKSDESCMLEIRGNRNIEKIYDILYANMKFCLNRKKMKFNDFKLMVDGLNKRYLTNEIVSEIKTLYVSGIKQSEISKIKMIPNSSVRTVIQRLRKNGEVR